MDIEKKLRIIPIPAFEDNYLWLIVQENIATIVDPGDAEPVIRYLETHQLQLDSILITHHHHDHIDGVQKLVERYPATVYAPSKGHYPFKHKPVSDHDAIMLHNSHLALQVIEVPGHTLDHVAYYAKEHPAESHLFCGDTLFAAGCGRLFEGTAEQMYASLQILAQLPPTTHIYCAHEYTLRNLAFAAQIEPDNLAILNRIAICESLRHHLQPTLPSNIALELETNPFLRCQIPSVIKSAGLEGDNISPADVFKAIRNQRNYF